MSFHMRRLNPGEEMAFVRSVQVPFLESGNEDQAEGYARHVEAERAWVVEERGRFVGNACIFSRDVTVPGLPGEACPVVPFAAVSGVGVHPTHRRRGLLRRLMAAMLADARERGEAFAGLLASESAIYERFGYGQATAAAGTVIDPRAGGFRPRLAPPPAGVELLDATDAAKVLPDLFDELRRARAGQVSRNEPVWADTFADPAWSRKGMSARFFAVTDGGFAVYRGAESGPADAERARLEVRDLYGRTPEVEASLWRFLLDIDLVGEIAAFPRPVDDPLRWRLADPRALRTTRVTDFLWVRILDVPAALAARRYRSEGRVVLEVLPAEVHDGPDPVAGRWVLDAGPDGCACSPAGPGDAVGVRLGAADLGSLYMGGVGTRTLAAAGRLAEETPGAAASLDRMLGTDPAPFTGTGF